MSNQPKTYTSDTIDVTFDLKRCIHAAECVRGLPAVFDTDKRPWIQPDQATADEVAEVVRRCPTGALHFERKDGGPTEEIPPENSLIPDPNGPLYLHGDLEILDSDGHTLLTDTRVALCRCGASQNKPFCDGAHHQIAFEDDGTLNEDSLSLHGETNGKLVIQTSPDGPLKVTGPLEIRSADGQTRFEGSAGELCRCGASHNKPFCDWSHVAAGFEAE